MPIESWDEFGRKLTLAREDIRHLREKLEQDNEAAEKVQHAINSEESADEVVTENTIRREMGLPFKERR